MSSGEVRANITEPIMGELSLCNGVVIPSDGLVIPRRWISDPSRMGKGYLTPIGERKVIYGGYERGMTGIRHFHAQPTERSAK